MIEAVGRPEAWEWAIDMVRKGGTVNFFGGCASGTKVQLDTNRLHYSEITLKATFHHTPETVRARFRADRGKESSLAPTTSPAKRRFRGCSRCCATC